MSDTITGAPSLGALSRAATPGPWAVDTEKSDGSYGSGEDTSEGYDTAVILTEAEIRYGKPGVLFESHNSTVGSISEESDDEWFRAWDAVSEANARFIVTLVNDFRAGRLHTSEALAQALAAARAKTDWQDIETAPKDGTPVLVAVLSLHEGRPMSVGEAYFRLAQEDGSVWGDDAWWWAGTSPGNYYDSPIHETNGRPMYWMPLPPPPTPAQTDTAPGGRADG